MSLVLDAALAAAQDSQSRRPIVEIVSAAGSADIPFDGQYLTTQTLDESSPTIIAHSSGRMIQAYAFDGHHIKFVYTDTLRTVFTTVDIDLGAGNTIRGLSICELTNGNVGMVYTRLNTGTDYLDRRVVTVTGTAVSNGSIANWASSIFSSDPWVTTLGANSYVVVYTKFVTPDYKFFKRTSADFVTWGAETEISIGGLTSTKKVDNPSLLILTTGQIWLFFDYTESIGGSGEELKNIYYSSTADLSTMASAVAITTYDTFASVGAHPVGIQKAASQMHVLFNNIVGALHMNDTTSGWPTGNCVDHLVVDSVNQKLYAVCIWSFPTTKYFQCVVKIDIPTWTVDKYWDTTTSPGFHPSYATNHCWWYINHSEHPKYVVTCGFVFAPHMVSVLDVEADSITNYVFEGYAPESIVQNVTWTSHGTYYKGDIRAAHIDIASNRLYLLMNGTSYDSVYLTVGYLDLTEVSDFQFHELWHYGGAEYDNAYDGQQNLGYRFDIANGYVISSQTYLLANPARMTIWNLDDGTIVEHWKYGVTSGFPYNGIYRYLFDAPRNKIWGCFDYTADYGCEDYRGLCEIDITSGLVRYHRPTYVTIDDYDFRDIAFGPDNTILLGHVGYGMAIYNPDADIWTLYNDDNVPGLDPGSFPYSLNHGIVYDSVSGLIYFGSQTLGGYGSFEGLTAFSQYGYLRQGQYVIGTSGGGAYSFASPDDLLQGYADYDPVAALDPGSAGSMFVFWTNEIMSTGEQSIKWDKDQSSFDTTPYLVNDKDLSLSRSIDGDPYSLQFSLSHGHLFDPYNKASLLSLYCKKGRKIEIRFGERISGVNVWQAAGTFFVTGVNFVFERGQYTDITITAEDERTIWANRHIFATEYYDGWTPEELIEEVVGTFAAKVGSDFDLPVFDNSVPVDHQWLETTIDEIVSQLTNRFGYYFRFTVENKISARKISDSNSIDHTYPDSTKIVRYAPDDRYSDFTNRVTILGQEREFQDVIFPEERVGAIAGTVGWWGYRNDFQIWYSEDKSRRCILPRLVIRETASSIPLQLAGSISETMSSLTDVGYENKYCTVYVSAPSLVGPLVAAVMAYVGFGWAIGNYAPPTGGLTISVGRWIEKALLIIILMILGSVGNFQYEIYAQPLGKVRRSVQGSDDDEENQVEIGTIVEKKFDDPLCYSVAECIAVAKQELLVAMMQRKRITITKIAHLQDEEGDTIRINHPISNTAIDIFITNLTRKFKKGTNNDGYFLDEIAGWVVSE
jgi:hypothetical protein